MFVSGVKMKQPVLLIGNNTFIIDGLRLLLNSQPDLNVIAKVSNGQITSEEFGQFSPNIIVKDLSDGILSELNNIERLKRIYKDPKILVLALDEHTNYLAQLRQAGICGYILKTSTTSELIRAIEIIALGCVYIDTSIADKLLDYHFKKYTRNDDKQNIKLSEREEEVLRLIARGYAIKEIAEKLSISVKTVETYKARITEKLNLTDRPKLIQYALDHGWLQPSWPTKPY